jgi:rubrerythrin
VWIDHHGELPRDSNGNLLDIHHINGDHSDNRIENMKAVTRAEHQRIHAMEFFEKTGKHKWHTFVDISERNKKSAQTRLNSGKHNLVINNPAKNGLNKRLLEDGKHIFQTRHPAHVKYMCSVCGHVSNLSGFSRSTKNHKPIPYNGEELEHILSGQRSKDCC